MAEPFDIALAAMLAPPERGPDRAFVRRISAAVALEQRLAARRSQLLRRLAGQFSAFAAMAAAVLILGLAPAISRVAAESPPQTLIVLLVSFSFLLVLMVPGVRARTGLRHGPRAIARA